MTPPPIACAVALTGLPHLGPGRLSALHRAWSPEDAWRHVVAGDAHDHPEVAAACLPTPGVVGAAWARAAAAIDPCDVLARHAAAGIGANLVGTADYPAVLAADEAPPVVLFHQGDPAALDGPRVAIVGTRRCTRYGRDAAFMLGADLAAAGVRVVSGLALGVDGAAHAGAIEAGGAPPIAVVGSGLDVVYPRAHRELWRRVAATGVVLSEAPLGARPEAWRFPARNRILAALADVVVVVESHAAGGSLLTVGEAIRRDRPVLAVPGPVSSASSAGCNDLLADGAAPVRDAGDVLVALGLTGVATRPRRERRPAPLAVDASVLDAFDDWQPASLDQLAVRTGLPAGDLALALNRLERDGWVASTGGWYERIGAGSGRR
jgi:DNA processing protein